MSDIAAALAQAQQRLARGDVPRARREAEALTRSASDARQRGQAHLLAAACAQRMRDLASALNHARAGLALDASNPAGHYLVAELLEASGDPRAARESVERAVALDPAFVQAWFYLGILRGEQGDAAGAARAFETVVRLDPRHARAWNNLGNARRNLALLEDARDAFAQAVAAKPDYALAVANLAKALRDLGEVLEAERVLRDALSRPSTEPPYRPLLVLLGGLTRERGFLDESAQLYWRAIQASPKESAGEWFSLGWVLSERGDPEKARDAYVNAYALDAKDLRGLIAQHLALPMIYRDAAGLESARANYVKGLEALEREIEPAVRNLTADQVLDGFRWTNFFLAYQGRNDRDLQARYARIVCRTVQSRATHWRAPMPRVAVAGRRIRIGFASAFLHVGTVGRYFRSWMTELPRERFELFIYHLWPGMDDIALAIRDRADHFRTFGGSDARPSIVAPAIRADDLDILVYPELGMDVSSFALAALRLAPRQFAGWGHPITTGHETVDAFISCETMEPPDAPEHYTERLVLLPGIGTRYIRPEVPQEATRAAFDLP
ncbi:MAG TPA: tetratricopeptide repeat protein, partial [Casimicrobiaceae bacterium]|nr:tetratricopeptide repeat protein [Casimicrobiaceae bacterium]